MFFRKERKVIFDKMQNCLETLERNNAALSTALTGIIHNQTIINEELGNICSEGIVLAKTLDNFAKNEDTIMNDFVKIQSNNTTMSEALAETLELNRTVITELGDSNGKLGEIINTTQTNNQVLAETLHQVVSTSNTPNEHVQYTEDEKWKAAYALNLCTVSISQIIEYNDLGFMDFEYENILNNLNLEMMPKDEALLDVLKQILDIITFFRIQDKERKLLDKEYQQKIKDAVWSAVPNPAVIMSGGSGGWVGLAITAAISVGTGYMNYRKEKAKIGLEQERKEWELERSLMEQLHGLRRQLFETSWRLAEEYQFSDKLRLTEKQIKQFNEMLRDDDSLRQYNRLNYVKNQYEAYPPFWYYLGSAALKVAHTFRDDALICKDFLDKANSHFDYFFEKSAFANKLLREDPIVAQGAFEYIATLNLKDEAGSLTIDQNIKNQLIGEKLDLAVNSSGNSLDVLQMCALNYLAADNISDSISILEMLINEYYNVASNAQLLSMLYVKSVASGKEEYKVSYELLTKTCPYKVEFYTMPSDVTLANFEELDRDFRSRQRLYLVNRCLDAIEAYIHQEEQIFNSIWAKEYDITEELVVFFENFAKALSILRPERGETVVKECLSAVLLKMKEEHGEDLFSNMSVRTNYTFASFIEDAVVCVVRELLEQIKNASNNKELSVLETKLLYFCNRYSLLNEKNIFVKLTTSAEQSIESVLTGKSLAQTKAEKQEFEECLQIMKDAKLCGEIIFCDSKKEIECFYCDSRQYEEYFSKHSTIIKSINGKVLAVIEDRKGADRIDLILTTKEICVISKHWYDNEWSSEYHAPYHEVKISSKSNRIDNHLGEKMYDQAPKDINYSALGDLFYSLKKIAEKYSNTGASNDSCESIVLAARNVRKGIFENDTANSCVQRCLPPASRENHTGITSAIVT